MVLKLPADRHMLRSDVNADALHYLIVASAGRFRPGNQSGTAKVYKLSLCAAWHETSGSFGMSVQT